MSNNFINTEGAYQLLQLLMHNKRIYNIEIKKNCINVHLLNDIIFQMKQNKATRHSREDPELVYLKYVQSMEEEHKKSLEVALK